MKMRTLAAALTLGMLFGTSAAQARTAEIEIGVAPPVEREYVIPEARPGYVYERPHYRWDGHTYVWSEGRYIRERPGHRYEQPLVVHRGDHWYFRAGHWDDDD